MKYLRLSLWSVPCLLACLAPACAKAPPSGGLAGNEGDGTGGTTGDAGSGGTAGNTGGSSAVGGGTGSAGSSGSAGKIGTGGMTGGAGSTGAAGSPPAAGGYGFPQNRTLPGCAAPTNRDSAAVKDVYLTWKSIMVTSSGAGPNALRVQRPESGNDTVSEGIGYGMLASVYLGDRATFDGLWAYAQAHLDSNHLMNWQLGPGGNTVGQGSATDADEDISFALLMAARQWNDSSYLEAGKTMVNWMWAYDVDHAQGEKLKGGDGWTEQTIYPSYFAPAFYRVYAAVTSQPGWTTVIDTSYELLAASSGSKGLAPETITFSGATKDSGYKYNSCRIPLRIAMDWCWNSEARARTYLTAVSGFFSGVGAADIVDGYDINGNPLSNNKDVMAFLGPAVAGASVSTTYQSFLDSGWTKLNELAHSGGSNNYYHASLGLLSQLFLTGNFSDFTSY